MMVDLDGRKPELNDNEETLYNELKEAADSYDDDKQRLLALPYNNEYEAMQKVLEYDQEITAAAEKYEVEKEMIQAVLFQEIRFYGLDDPFIDSLVVQSFAYDEQLKAYEEGTLLFAPEPVLFYRRNTSTGLGQVQISTAIDALNHYNEINEKKKRFMNLVN